MKYYGVFNPPADQVLYENYFKDVREGVFMECGAGNGIYSNNSLVYERELDWKCINIEANPDTFKLLQRNRPDSFLNVNVALSNSCGTARINQLGENSSLRQRPHQKMLQEKRKMEDSYIDVETVTLKAFVERHGIECINVLVLDVEGHELEVMEGFVDSSVTPDVICMEYPHVTTDFPGGLEEMAKVVEHYGYHYNFFVNNDAYFSKAYERGDRKWFGASPANEEWTFMEGSMNWGHRG